VPILETQVASFTGEWLYSDFSTHCSDGGYDKDTKLNCLVRLPLLGIMGGVIRISLGIIHTLGHLVVALFTMDKGHLYHAAKGGG